MKFHSLLYANEEYDKNHRKSPGSAGLIEKIEDYSLSGDSSPLD